jgi:hypothetical protein
VWRHCQGFDFTAAVPGPVRDTSVEPTFDGTIVGPVVEYKTDGLGECGLSVATIWPGHSHDPTGGLTYLVTLGLEVSRSGRTWAARVPAEPHIRGEATSATARGSEKMSEPYRDSIIVHTKAKKVLICG